MKNLFKTLLTLFLTLLLSTTVFAAQHGGNGSEQQRERMQTEMEEHTRQDGDAGMEQSRDRERMTEETRKEADSDKTEPSREAKHKWWEFWK